MAGTARQRMSQELAARFEREALPHRMMLLRSALRLTRHAHDAEDLVQETMAKACASFHSYQPGTNARGLAAPHHAEHLSQQLPEKTA